MSEQTKPNGVKIPEIDIKATHVVKSWKYDSPFTACRFDPSGRFVYAAAQDNTIQRWEVATDKQVSLAAHDSWLRAIGFSKNGKQLFTAGYDGQLIIWQADDESPKPIKRIDAHDGWVRWLSVSSSGQWMATGGNDNLVKIWNTEGELQQTLKKHEAHVYSVYFHPNDATLLSGDLLGNVHQWEISTGKFERTLDAKDLHTYNGGQQAHYGGVRSMSLSSDGKYLACGGLHKATNPFGAVQEPLVVVFDWKDGKKSFTHEANGIPNGIVWRVIYHPNGSLIGASGGGSGGFVLFWKAGEQKEVYKFKLPNTALDLDLHPNGKELVTAHYDKQIRISRMIKKADA